MHPSRLRMTALWCCCFWTMYTALAADTAPPLQNFSADYEISSGQLKVGTLRRKLVIDAEQHYRFESNVEASGLLAMLHRGQIEESSVGTLTAGQVRPLTYRYRKRSGKKQKETNIEFDWAAGRITTTAQGQRWQMAPATGVLDKLVYQLALMQDLAHAAPDLRYLVADGGRTKTYEVARQSEETLQILGQAEPTLKVAYLQQGTSRRTVFWCAPRYRFLPVQIEYRDDDSRVTKATLVRYQ